MRKKYMLGALLLAVSMAAPMSLAVMADETEIETETETELVEYAVEGVGVFYLPEGFEVESGKSEEGLPMTYALLRKDDIEVSASRFGKDAYDAAGVDLPEDLEDYSQREGVRAILPEGEDFEVDEFGNLGVIVTYDEEPEEEAETEEGRTLTMYQALKQGTEAYGAVSVICPEDMFEEIQEEAGLWLSLMELE